MAEPTRQVGARIHISPDNAKLRRSWPDPRATTAARWKAHHDPSNLTVDEIRCLAEAAEAYTHMFEVSQRDLLPSHAAIRAHIAHGENGASSEPLI